MGRRAAFSWNYATRSFSTFATSRCCGLASSTSGVWVRWVLRRWHPEHLDTMSRCLARFLLQPEGQRIGAGGWRFCMALLLLLLHWTVGSGLIVGTGHHDPRGPVRSLRSLRTVQLGNFVSCHDMKLSKAPLNRRQDRKRRTRVGTSRSEEVVLGPTENDDVLLRLAIHRQIEHTRPL